MKYVIVYWSRYGNGKKIVDRLVEKLKSNKMDVEVFKTDDADPTSMPDADVYVFSAPTEAFNIQKNMRKFIKRLECMDGKKCAMINTHGMDRNWLPKMEKPLLKKGMVNIAGVEFRVGKDAGTGNALMDGWEDKLDDFLGKI